MFSTAVEACGKPGAGSICEERRQEAGIRRQEIRAAAGCSLPPASRRRPPAASLTSGPSPPRIRPLYEAHLPAQQSATQTHARLPRPDADTGRARRDFGSPAQGAQETHGVNSGPAVSETFSKDDRLRKRREFEECYATGVRVSGRHIQVFLLDDPRGQPTGAPSRPRLGISVSRRVGNAVTRNRVRRRLREIFRRTRPQLSIGAARLVINARPSCAAAAFSELLEDYRSAVSRAISRRTRR